jgi:queuine/archaeosine tRNA-ribosyltransferase
MEQVNLNKILSELEFLKQRVFQIENSLDSDVILTQDDMNSLQDAEKEFENGETTSLEKLKEELEI